MALCLPPKNRRIHTGWHSLTSKSLPVSYRFASTTASKPTQERKKAYSQTLRLPKTTFPLRHKDIATAEKQYRRKISDNLYRHQFNNNQGSLFVLHDGPPYANGHLHMGHALNKILKDMINRYKVIRGHRVHYVPGWDCHGLPIEQKALAAIGKSHTSLLPNQVRDEARRVALEAIEIQKHEMKDLGIMADWDGPGGTYRTLGEANQSFYMRFQVLTTPVGFITHRLRPVYYSPSSRTALAEAELVYQDGHQSRSVFVTFPVHKYDMSPGLRKIYDAAAKKIGQQALSLAVWTTTPWSLPGNSGVAVHPEMEYAVVSSSSHGLLVIAIERVEAIQKLVGSLEVMGTLDGSQLVNTQYSHLFHPPSSLCKPSIFSASHVTSQTGTGLVHSAPAHGHEDYVAFAKAGIMPKHLRCPIDDDGRFTEEIVSFAEDDSVAFLVGQDVLGEGTDQMVELLRRKRLLLAEETIEHRYPYDWKSKKPIIIRATPQWFADIEQVKDSALKALDSLQFHPPLARKRLKSFLSSRSEWCISRQRSWGVPIPVLFDAYGHPLMDRETLNHVIGVLDAKGIDYWWTGSLEDFIPLFRKGQLISKGIDTLDVWFDSGSSWTMLLKDQMRSSSLPLADLYLEGSDQHRGWFQSSLLTKLIGTDDGRAPYGSVITHGFIMDEDGKKMSKSAGNGLSPMQIVHGSKLQNLPAYGSDVLRLWAASVDYTSDVSIRPSSISHACETLRRLRNTTRFLLANSSTEFKSALREVTLRPIDLFILHEMSCLESVAQQSYDEYDFSKVINTTSAFSISTLSTLYFEIVKDTLYCDKEDNPTRKATIAVLRHVLERLTKIIAPIVPHLAEELYDHTENGTEDSVFMQSWEPDTTWVNPAVTRDMEKLLELRPGVQQLIEHARSDRYALAVLKLQYMLMEIIKISKEIW
nr:isoleucine-tRNA ligase [Cryptococcus depauperatus CBS 7841]